MAILGTFLLMSFLLIILPGPDSSLVIQNSIMYGQKAGFKTVMGSVSGLLIHTSAAVLGLSALLMQSATLFTILKYIGAAYLIYIGFSALRTLKNPPTEEEIVVKGKEKSFFLQGFITCASNPKVAVFFLTFLPQFVQPNYNHMLQFAVMGIIYAVMTIIWFLLYVYLIDVFSKWLKRPTVQKSIQGCTGIVLLLFGLRLALEKTN
ncbi:MAG: LysE family translocator [Kurthia gibsonii]|uniref:LysE family translocator n=1 Tax=Kurthia gibsonii TaxID=33946 RepID=A0ABU9LN36_9BACL|nr:LysE family translocator [Kurthia gibsonii]MEB7773251.1 LysE family translocator [Kurthia gibsonii]RXH53680.1 LysE family translocator [Kurthia gibsonii]GED20782.1 lysine transporter LysE [Kurthia gibsonii]HZG11687.1 LysE family translocator [Kurthia gibsonii]